MDYVDLKIVDNPMLVRDHALDKLRNAISTGLYPPGARLVERELCEALGVSRTSVREALRQLQAESLIEVGKRRNIRVAVITAQDAEDIYIVREMLETLAIRRFVQRADPAATKALATIHKEIKKALNRSAPGVHGVADLADMAGAFYRTLLAGSGSRVVAETARQLQTRVNYLRQRSMSEPGRLEAGLREWDEIMAAVMARDVKRAEAAMAEHLRLSRLATVARLQAEERERPPDAA